MDDDRKKRTPETNYFNLPMTNVVTPTMMIVPVLMMILLLTNSTTTRTVITCVYDVHVPVTKGGTLNVSSGGLQSTPNDDYLFSPWDVWLHNTLEGETTTIELATDKDTARYRNLDIPRERSRNIVYSSLANHLEQRDKTTNASGRLCRTNHHGDDTEGVAHTSSTGTSLVSEIPPEPPPGGQESHFRKHEAYATSSTSSINLQRNQQTTEVCIMNPRLQWDVGRGETSASEEREGDSRSRSRPGVQLRIDQNATGDESEATPSSSQQGSKTNREDDRLVRDNRVAAAPRKSLGGSALFRPWDMWIQHAFQLKERRRKQHISDWR